MAEPAKALSEPLKKEDVDEISMIKKACEDENKVAVDKINNDMTMPEFIRFLDWSAPMHSKLNKADDFVYVFTMILPAIFLCNFEQLKELYCKTTRRLQTVFSHFLSVDAFKEDVLKLFNGDFSHSIYKDIYIYSTQMIDTRDTSGILKILWYEMIYSWDNRIFFNPETKKMVEQCIPIARSNIKGVKPTMEEINAQSDFIMRYCSFDNNCDDYSQEELTLMTITNMRNLKKVLQLLDKVHVREEKANS
jgi:hypothetical protein